jgi:hypothetical protein
LSIGALIITPPRTEVTFSTQFKYKSSWCLICKAHLQNILSFC